MIRMKRHADVKIIEQTFRPSPPILLSSFIIIIICCCCCCCCCCFYRSRLHLVFQSGMRRLAGAG